MRILSFLVSPAVTKKNLKTFTKTYYQNPLPGTEVGIPLLLFENIFTNIHYGYDITTPEIVFLEFAFAFLTYGFDRLQDSYDVVEIKADKQELYSYFRENKDNIVSALMTTYFITFYLLSQQQETIPFILGITSTSQYKKIKSIIGPFKPVYISLMWTIGCYFLPCVIADNDYSSLSQPLDYLPIFLTLFGSSNLADARDIVEDKNNNINTIPVLLGEDISNSISCLSILFASFLFFHNPNFYDREIFNGIYGVQNSIIGLAPIIANKTIYKLP